MGSRSHIGRGNFEGEGRPIVKYRSTVHVLQRCGLLSNYVEHLSISVG